MVGRNTGEGRRAGPGGVLGVPGGDAAGLKGTAEEKGGAGRYRPERGQEGTGPGDSPGGLALASIVPPKSPRRCRAPLGKKGQKGSEPRRSPPPPGAFTPLGC